MNTINQYIQKYRNTIATSLIGTAYVVVFILCLFAGVPSDTQNTDTPIYQIIHGSQMQSAPDEKVAEISYGEFLSAQSLKNEEIIAGTNIYEVPQRTDIDFTAFDASYNKLVYNAQVQINTSCQEFEKWFDSLIGCDITNETNYSVIFVSWCAYKSGMANNDLVPITDTIDNLVTFYKAQNTFYKGATSCAPRIGDIVILDDNRDGMPDKAAILIKVDSSESQLNVISGEYWCKSYNDYIVANEIYDLLDKRIYGYCRPKNITRHVSSYGDLPNLLPMNGLDTVTPIRNEKYVEILAQNGIEVIARYINPEGRHPLTKEEAQMFSNYGIRTMMIYQINKGDPYKGYETGLLFGSRALEYARNIGAPKGIPIFFCVDTSDEPENNDKLAAFLQGAREAMKGEYCVGIYGGYYTIQAVANTGLADALWQCWGFSGGYLSDEYDMMQWSIDEEYFEDVPITFDANHVKNVEKVSFILPPTN